MSGSINNLVFKVRDGEIFVQKRNWREELVWEKPNMEELEKVSFMFESEIIDRQMQHSDFAE